MDKNFRYIQEDKILVAHQWVSPKANLIEVVDNKINTKKNFITRIVKHNYDKNIFCYHNIEEGDLVFLSRYMLSAKSFELGSSKTKYSSLPVTQILGVFRDENEDFNSLEILDSNILVEPIKELNEGGLTLTQQENSKCNIGRVVKCGKGGFFPDWTRKDMTVDVGDIILYWDNITTPLFLEGKHYLCVGEYGVVGRFTDGNIDTNNLEMLNGRILLSETDEVKINGIFIPKVSEDVEEYSRPEDRFKVGRISEKGTEVKKGVFSGNQGVEIGDTLLIDPAFLKGVSFKGKQYYTIETVEDAKAILYE